MALLPCINGADGDPFQSVTALHTFHDHIYLKLKPLFLAVKDRLHHPETQQPVTGLVIAHRLPQSPGKAPTTNGVGKPADEWYLAEIPGTDDQISAVLFISLDEFRDLSRVMLSINQILVFRPASFNTNEWLETEHFKECQGKKHLNWPS